MEQALDTGRAAHSIRGGICHYVARAVNLGSLRASLRHRRGETTSDPAPSLRVSAAPARGPPDRAENGRPVAAQFGVRAACCCAFLYRSKLWDLSPPSLGNSCGFVDDRSGPRPRLLPQNHAAC